MRISDNRYERDRERIDAAVRLLGSGAGVTITAQLSGLSKDRITKLRRAYPLHAARHRVRTPKDPLFFLHSPAVALAATTYASVCYILGLRPPDTPLTNTLGQVEILVQAYEVYRTLDPTGRLSFDRAFAVMTALSAGRTKLVTCNGCARFFLAPYSHRNSGSCGCSRDPRLYRRCSGSKIGIL